MKAGDRFIDQASGRSGTITNIFLAEDPRAYEEIDPEDVPDVCAIVVKLDGDAGYWTEDVTGAGLVPLDTVLN